MPIFFQQEIDENTRLAIWKIEEEESFFSVPLQREITHPHKRQQHLAGRYLLRYLFADFPLDLIRIADTRKPYLESEVYHFSISHCSDFAAAIVSRNKRVGIDIEVPTPKAEKIKHKFLHPDELAMVNEHTFVHPKQSRMPGENTTHETPDAKLTLLWSAKEAVFKWWSYGNVDFSEMIRLQPFDLQPVGYLEGAFHSKTMRFALLVHYRLFPELCLAWTVN